MNACKYCFLRLKVYFSDTEWIEGIFMVVFINNSDFIIWGYNFRGAKKSACTFVTMNPTHLYVDSNLVK